MALPKTAPHADDLFWFNKATERLKNPYISKEYRQRLEWIRDDAKLGMNVKVTNGHYPRKRQIA